MKRTLLPAFGVGLLTGVGVYQIVPDVAVSLVTASVYAGAAYFYVAFDVSLFAAAPRFDDPADKAGYGLGLFGLSASPILFSHYAGGDDAAVLGLVVAFLGAVAFLTLSEQARRLGDGAE